MTDAEENQHWRELYANARRLAQLIDERGGKGVPVGGGSWRGIPWTHHRNVQQIVGGTAMLLTQILPLLAHLAATAEAER